MANTVQRRKRGNGVKIKLNDDTAQKLLALLGQCECGNVPDVFDGLYALYGMDRKYRVEVNAGAIKVRAI